MKYHFPLPIIAAAAFILLMLLYKIPVEAARVHDEAFYQGAWCEGEREYRLPDHTRVDCLTDTHAVEVDFADKWYNGVGQALHYAAMTDKEPGLLLIVESMGDLKYVERAQNVAMRQDIRIWLIWP